ncbi:MAG TPA: hypothetical protein VEY67_04085, partial [Candidatus Dormibacteraeota bacterium]|nr:hypothetical protein [Candidatus Dormibacteraeota bacterium]
LYQGVVDADPRNSIAVVGLARVALERGEDLEALRLGRSALRIDERNVAAQRLVARLEEVLAVRGVEVPPDLAEAVAREVVAPEAAAPEVHASQSEAARPGQAEAAETEPRRPGLIRRLLGRGR